MVLWLSSRPDVYISCPAVADVAMVDMPWRTNSLAYYLAYPPPPQLPPALSKVEKGRGLRLFVVLLSQIYKKVAGVAKEREIPCFLCDHILFLRSFLRFSFFWGYFPNVRCGSCPPLLSLSVKGPGGREERRWSSFNPRLCLLSEKGESVTRMEGVREWRTFCVGVCVKLLRHGTARTEEDNGGGTLWCSASNESLTNLRE